MRILTCLLILLLWPTGAFAEERWYIFSIGGTPVGWVSEDVDGLRTRTLLSARLTRLGKSVDMRFETITTEAATGVLERLDYEALLSKQPMRLQVLVEPDRIRLLTPPQERALERGAAPLLGPLAVTRLTVERLRAAGDRVEYTIFSPELQRVVTVRRHLVATSERLTCGSAAANRVEETIEGLPTPRTLWLDAGGVMVSDSIAGPFGPMTTCRATKEAALAANGTLPADLYERTLARSNVRFADPFSLDRVVVRVTPRDASQALPDVTAHNQRVIRPGLVEIRRPSRAGTPDARPAPEFLEPNALVESANEEVVATAKRLARADRFETAQALTTWTAEHLTLDAGIVMAPASELIRDRRATCMGYATLLAALARAAGLPSRIAMGYVYYGGIWGGHAWTEMFVDGRWLPFDAAVFAPGIASAARLAVGASSFADGGGSLTGPLSLLFGRVDIETVEYQQDGRVVRVEEGARPFQSTGTSYTSRGLGLRITAADGWRVDRADATWPSTMVVAFRRGATSIELHQKARYPERPVARDGDAMFVSVEGSTLWVWTARGPDAAGALTTMLTRVERVR